MCTFRCNYGLGFVFLYKQKCYNKFRNTNLAIFTKLWLICNMLYLHQVKDQQNNTFVFVYDIINDQHLNFWDAFIFFEVVIALTHVKQWYFDAVFKHQLIIFALFLSKILTLFVINFWGSIFFVFLRSSGFIEMLYGDSGNVFFL